MEPPQPTGRIRDAAVLLPVLGLILLMPPVVTLFVANVVVAGIPLIVVYLFSVWAGLIAATALLARHL